MKNVLKFFGLYMIITLSTAFGITGIALLSAPSSNSTKVEELSTIDKLITKFSSFNEILDLNASIEIVSSDINATIDANLSLDVSNGTENIQCYGTLVVNYNNTNYTVDVVYTNSDLYVTYSNITIKTTADGMVNAITTALTLSGMDLSSLDFGDLDVMSLLNNITETPTTGGTLIGLQLFDFGYVEVLVDDNLNIIQLNQSTLNIAGFEITLSATADYVDHYSITTPNTYYDFTPLFGSLEQFLSNQATLVNLNTQLAVAGSGFNIDVDADLNIDFTKGYENFDLCGTLALTYAGSKYDFNVLYTNGTAYLTYNNVTYQVEVQSIIELIGGVITLLNVDMSLSLDLSTIDFGSLIAGIYANNTENGLQVGINLDSMGNVQLLFDNNSNNLVSIYNSELLIDGTYINISNATVSHGTAFDTTVPTDTSELNSLIDGLKNTLSLSDFNITGTVDIDILFFSLTVGFDISVKTYDKTDLEIVAIINVPVNTLLNNDTPYTPLSISNRILTITYVDGYVHIHRTEKVNFLLQDSITYEKQVKVEATEFMNDIMYYLVEYGFGIDIDSLISENSDESTDSQEEEDDAQQETTEKNYLDSVLDFTTDNQGNYTVMLDLFNLLDSDMFDTLTLGLKTQNLQEVDGKTYLNGLTLKTSIAVTSGIDISVSSNDIALNKIGEQFDFAQTLTFAESDIYLTTSPLYTTSAYDFIANYLYNEEEFWVASNGSWSMEKANQHTIEYNVNGGLDMNTTYIYPNATFTLPTPVKQIVLDDNSIDYYTFIGWYTTPTFDGYALGESLDVQRNDYVLYAKWEYSHNVLPTYYTVTFNTTESSQAYDSLSIAENTFLDLTNYSPSTFMTWEYLGETKGGFLNQITYYCYNDTTYTFNNWYLDAECTMLFDGTMPSNDITLYAKWDTTLKYTEVTGKR